MTGKSVSTDPSKTCQLWEIREMGDFPKTMDLQALCEFLHQKMKPYEDTVPDVRRALEYALVPGAGQGGFVLVAARDGRPVGAIVILNTGMGGYVPEHILLFVGVDPDERGHGIGGWLVREALDRCPGDVKLHVEYDNPAKRLYERVGFTTKYAEMRIPRGCA